MINLLRRARGPALAHYRGQTFFTKDAFNLVPDLKPFAVESDSTPAIDGRYGGRLIKSSWTPIGAWEAAALAVLYPYASFNKGQFTTPVRTVTAVSTVTGALTIPAHNQISGTGARLASTGALPTGLSATTTYYINVDDANDILLYDTYDHAIAGGDPGLVTPTDAGTGTIKLIQNTPLLINYLDADLTQIAFWNAAITKMPSLTLGATKTAFGQIEFSCYCLHGQSWSDDDSIFTIGTHDEDESAVDPTQIPTVPYSMQFGDAAPFSDLQPREAIALDFNLKLDEVMSDDEGIVTHSLSDLEAMAKVFPLNLTEADLWGELLMQGDGAGRGQSLPSALLKFLGPASNPYIQLFNAQLQDGGLKVGSKEDRIAQISFKSIQSFSGGNAQPIFYVGTEAP